MTPPHSAVGSGRTQRAPVLALRLVGQVTDRCERSATGETAVRLEDIDAQSYAYF